MPRSTEESNQATIHMLLTPARWAYNIFAAFCFLVAVLLIVSYYALGWIVNLGPYSVSARQEQIADVGSHVLGPDNQWGSAHETYRIDFRKQVADGDETAFAAASDPWDRNDPVKNYYPAFTAIDLWGATRGDLHAVPHCVSPGDWAYDDRIASFLHPDRAFDAKSGRMRRDYEIAALETAALRSALAHAKLHRPMALPPDNAEDFFNDPAHNFCNAYAEAHNPKYGAAGGKAYSRAVMSVYLPDAPVIKLRYIQRQPEDRVGMDDPNVVVGPWEVYGFCLDANTACDLAWGADFYDLLAKRAPLTDDQIAVENQMLEMTTGSFWEKEAAANGILYSQEIESMRQAAGHLLAYEFAGVGYDPILHRFLD